MKELPSLSRTPPPVLEKTQRNSKNRKKWRKVSSSDQLGLFAFFLTSWKRLNLSSRGKTPDLPGCSAYSDPTGRRASGDRQRVSTTTDMDHNPKREATKHPFHACCLPSCCLKCVLLGSWFLTLWAKLLKRPKYCAQFFTFSGTSLSSKDSRASVRLSRPGSPNWSALSRVFSRIEATTTLTSLTLHSKRQTLRKPHQHVS